MGLRSTIRTLLCTRWFTVAAALTFALGIGLNLAVFSIVDRMLFRPLPYGDADRLVLLRVCDRKGECYGAFPSILAFEARERLRAFGGVAVGGRSTAVRVSANPDDPPIRFNGASANLLRVLRVQPILGRDFGDGDVDGSQRVALLAHDTWRTRFGADPQVPGRTLGTGASAVTIVGVLPPDFIPPTWTTMDARTDGLLLETKGWAAVTRGGSLAAPIARLAEGVSLDAARAEVQALIHSLASELRRNGELPLIRVDRLQDSLFSRFTRNAWLIVAAAAVLLALACANLANLMLARGRSREHVMAVHAALGAGRRRLIAMAVAESVVICLAGVAVAFVALAIGVKWLLAITPPLFARYAAGTADPRVLGFAVATVLVCSVFTAVLPAWRASRVDVLSLLQRGSPSARRSPRSTGGRFLILVEAALGVVLVLGGFIAVSSYRNLDGEDLGFNPRHLFTVGVRGAGPVASSTHEARLSAYKRLIEVLGTAPGVRSVAGADRFVGDIPQRALSSNAAIAGGRFLVDASYFDTLQTPILAGRVFTAREVQDGAGVAVLNASAARVLFPGEPPSSIAGRSLALDPETPRLIVGIVADAKPRGRAAEPALFLPLGAFESQYSDAIVRLHGSGPAALALIRQTVQDALGPSASVSIRPATIDMDVVLDDPRFRAVVLGVLSLAALLLAAVGLYAVCSFDVAMRRYELGVRLAIGATGRDIQRHVLIGACRPVVVGIAIGLAAAYWIERYVQSFMYGVQPRDPALYAVVSAVLLATALLAGWLPASRAARLDPAEVLRTR